MKVRCKLIREGGTKVNIDGVDYHFKPTSAAADALHVAEVTDKAHLARFLSIPEAYELHEDVRTDPVIEQKPVDEDPVDEPSDYLITAEGGKDIDLGTMTRGELLKFAETEKITLAKKITAKGSSKQAVLKAVFAAVTAD